jgi:hypothetical protein
MRDAPDDISRLGGSRLGGVLLELGPLVFNAFHAGFRVPKLKFPSTPVKQRTVHYRLMLNQLVVHHE